VKCRRQVLSVINDKRRIFDIAFPTKLLQRPLRQRRRSRCKQPYVQKFVGAWIDGSPQPELLAVNSDHGFGKHGMIRTRTVSWL